MRIQVKTVNVYSYGELSEEAKYNVANNISEFDADCTLDDFKEVAGILGFYDVVPRYRGFYSQGDGASFTGRYKYAKGAAKKIREFAPNDKELHAIADALQAVQKRNFYRLRAILTTGSGSNFYAHENTISFEVYDSENEYRDLIGDDDTLIELARDLMTWLYSQLETDYEYQTSDEYIAELCEANGYEFTENGDLI